MNSLKRMIEAMRPISVYSLMNYTIVYKELLSYAAVLDIIDENIDELIKECYLSTAEDFGVSIYEKLDGAERTDLSIEQRRKMLENAFAVNANDNTLKGLEKFFSSIGLEYSIKERPHICDLYIRAKGRDYSETEQKYIIDRAEKFLPCHMSFTIDFRTVNWAYFDSLNLTFQEMDDKNMTWKQIEQYKEE